MEEAFCIGTNLEDEQTPLGECLPGARPARYF